MLEYITLYIDQGTDFSENITISDENDVLVNIANYSFASAIVTVYANTNIAGSFICSTIDTANGVMSISMNANTSLKMAAESYYWDLFSLNNVGKTIKEKEGTLIIRQSITPHFEVI